MKPLRPRTEQHRQEAAHLQQNAADSTTQDLHTKKIENRKTHHNSTKNSPRKNKEGKRKKKKHHKNARKTDHAKHTQEAYNERTSRSTTNNPTTEKPPKKGKCSEKAFWDPKKTRYDKLTLNLSSKLLKLSSNKKSPEDDPKWVSKHVA